MNQRTTLLTAAVMGALAVAVGAFGAHGLKQILAETGRSDVFETAVRYHFYHALALLLNGVLMNQFTGPTVRYTSLLFTLGVVFFSGSLYVLSLTGIGVLGAITPVGGVLFIAGWVCLFVSVYKK
jgi:uncharacterized membrane protein YgdD (TMEM256/DUF423 family)